MREQKKQAARRARSAEVERKYNAILAGAKLTDQERQALKDQLSKKAGR
jgi:hypothetical protein